MLLLLAVCVEVLGCSVVVEVGMVEVRARTNCGECGRLPVTNGNPKSGPIAQKLPMAKKER